MVKSHAELTDELGSLRIRVKVLEKELSALGNVVRDLIMTSSNNPDDFLALNNTREFLGFKD